MNKILIVVVFDSISIPEELLGQTSDDSSGHVRSIDKKELLALGARYQHSL